MHVRLALTAFAEQAPWWFPGLLGLVGAALGSGGVTAVLQGRAERGARRAEAVTADIRAAQDALKALRAALRAHWDSAAAAPTFTELRSLSVDLEVAADRTGCDEVVRRAREYVDLGERFAVREEDAGVEAEAQAYRALADALREELVRNR